MVSVLLSFARLLPKGLPVDMERRRLSDRRQLTPIGSSEHKYSG